MTVTTNEDAARFLSRKPSLLINNEWVDSTGSDLIDVINPATEETISQIVNSTAGDVEKAVAAARAAFDGGEWGKQSAGQREALLHKLADLIEANKEELAELEYLDNGKPRKFFLGGDVPGAARNFRYFAGWATKIYGQTAESSYSPDHHVYTRKEPVGVAGMITPWNVPLAMATWKLAPALAAGCACVLKPAEETSLSALKLGELIVEAGFPPGAVNIVTGDGVISGAAITAHDDVDKVAFTGSTKVGKMIVQAATGNLKKVSLELGGKSPTLVFPDANLKKAIPTCAMGIFMNSGQICAAGSRLYVHEDVFDEVVDGIVAFAKNLKVGPGDDPDSVMGPLVNQTQLDTVSGYVDLGRKEGAEVLTGGSRPYDRGYFYEPTVLVDATDSMRVTREEIFGPVLVAQKFSDADEAIARANDSEYGLFARAWTQDVSLAHSLAAKFKAGNVHINGGTPPDPNIPFGGYKQSGWGREFGREGLDLYLQTKSVLIAI
jgi:phenylacetaldehyde dehydrogenase